MREKKTHLFVAAAPVLSRIPLAAIAFLRTDSAEPRFTVAIHDAPSFLAAVVLHFLRGEEKCVFSIRG